VVSVRVVAVTLRNLKAEAQRGAFRGDLYYRLAGFELELPPLRRRRGDIPLLVRHFLRELEPEIGAREIDAAALEALQRAEWPGNIRELRNAVRRAAILTGSRIDEAALELPPPPRFRIAESTMSPGPPRVPGPPAMGSDGEAVYARRDPHLRLAEVDPVPAPLPAADLFAEAVHAGAAGVTTHSVSLPGRTFEEIEREVLAWALRQNAGSRRRAARSLAIARSTFCDRVKKLNLA
jgi:DNA-binding NtrC family response regulator